MEIKNEEIKSLLARPLKVKVVKKKKTVTVGEEGGVEAVVA